METKENLLITSEIEARQLPALIENGISITDNYVQRDMLFLGMGTTISYLLPKFYFRHGYPASEYGANLMTLILAPAASGKGILKRALHMVEWTDHVLPGNASVSAFVNEYARMNGHALMMETEADVMSKALHQNGTDYSYILRQAAEHETIRRARDGKDKQRIVIKNPHLSVLLSGTLGQLKPLLRSRENGLTSRFMTYIVKDIAGFDERVFGQNISYMPDADGIFKMNEEYLKALYDWQEKSDHRCEFRLTDEQQAQLTEAFEGWYEVLMKVMQYPVSYDSCIKRMAISVMRLGMVLNAVRLDTDEPFPTEMVCTEEDFKTMLLVVDKMVYHLVEVLELLPEEEDWTDTTITMTDRSAEAKARREALLSKLPETFTTRMAIETGEAMGVPESTIDRWLIQWNKGQEIERIAQGLYHKTSHEVVKE